MLVAYGPAGSPILTEETSLEQLQHWSHERQLFCPNCRNIVHVRGGPEKRTQLHFAHQRGECAWSTEAESVRHMQGKLVLSRWLQTQFPQARVTLEERLPEPNRIADIFVQHTDGRRWAIEFQCAPLEIAQWRLRHDAYRQAGIIDSWIIGVNRREKQEAFIEAILAFAHEILFLDPLLTPARSWLRWPVPRQQAQHWSETIGKALFTMQEQTEESERLALHGWVGQMGYGVTLATALAEVCFDTQAKLIHPTRTQVAERSRLQQKMNQERLPGESSLTAYMRERISTEELDKVLIPLLKAYLRDTELLRRYNYGRGSAAQGPDQADQQRIDRAVSWLRGLAQYGYTSAQLQILAQEIPLIGPYIAFANYAEQLLALL